MFGALIVLASLLGLLMNFGLLIYQFVQAATMAGGPDTLHVLLLVAHTIGCLAQPIGAALGYIGWAFV
jgi:hypothetical protein